MARSRSSNIGVKTVFFNVSLVPRDLVIEAESEADFKERCKHIPIEHLVFSWKQMSKKDFKNELKTRRVFLK